MGFKTADTKSDVPQPRPENEVKVELVDEVVPIPQAKNIHQAAWWIICDDVRQYILGKPRVHPYQEDYEKARAMAKFTEAVKGNKR